VLAKKLPLTILKALESALSPNSRPQLMNIK